MGGSRPHRETACSARKGAVAVTESRLARGFNSTNSSTNRPPLSGSRRISIGWKARSCAFRDQRRRRRRQVWTGDHRRPLVFVRLRATRGYREKCVALPEGGDDTCCSASSPLPRRASPATAGCEALGTTYPHPSRMAIGARAEIATASTAAVGDQGRVVWPTQVNRRKRRKQRQAKGADRLGPKR